MEGMYNWPFCSVGNFMLTFGQKFKLTASLTSVKEPEINA
jgi:hypothetical protein